jgi:hypothetical protein
VVAEEIAEKLAENGLPREEQGELVGRFVRTIADEISKLWRAAS